MTVSSVITVIVHFLDTLEYMCSKNIGIGISISKEGQILLHTGLERCVITKGAPLYHVSYSIKNKNYYAPLHLFGASL